MRADNPKTLIIFNITYKFTTFVLFIITFEIQLPQFSKC